MTIKEIDQDQTWKIRHMVMWPEMPLEFVKLADDAEGVHFGLFDDGDLVSVVSCFFRNGQMQFRKLATLTEKQGKGYGTYLLNYIIGFGKRKQVSGIWCNARFNKKSFYEKFGMVEINKRFAKDGIEFTIMELKI